MRLYIRLAVEAPNRATLVFQNSINVGRVDVELLMVPRAGQLVAHPQVSDSWNRAALKRAKCYDRYRMPIGGYKVLTKHVRSECPLVVVLGRYFTPGQASGGHAPRDGVVACSVPVYDRAALDHSLLGQLVSRLAGSA
jgi:hypothetical protein